MIYLAHNSMSQSTIEGNPRKQEYEATGDITCLLKIKDIEYILVLGFILMQARVSYSGNGATHSGKVFPFKGYNPDNPSKTFPQDNHLNSFPLKLSSQVILDFVWFFDNQNHPASEEFYLAFKYRVKKHLPDIGI